MISVAILAVALVAAPAVEELPSPNDHFKKESWSDFSWNGLRWGMGFGDVLAVLEKPEGIFRVRSNFRCDDVGGDKGMARGHVIGLASCWIDSDSHSLEMVGTRPLIALGFWKQRLWNITVFPHDLGDFKTFGGKAGQVMTILREKYGYPTVYPKGFRHPMSPPEDPAICSYTFTKGSLEVQLSLVYGGRNPKMNTHNQMSVTYTNENAADDLNRNGRTRSTQAESSKF